MLMEVRDWSRLKHYTIMGGLCSRRATSENTTGRSIPHVNGHFNYGAGTVYQSHRLPPQANNDSMQSPLGESTENQPSEPVFSFPELNAASHGVEMDAINDGIPRLSRALSNKTRPTRSKQVAMAKVNSLLFIVLSFVLWLMLLSFSYCICDYVKYFHFTVLTMAKCKIGCKKWRYIYEWIINK